METSWKFHKECPNLRHVPSAALRPQWFIALIRDHRVEDVVLAEGAVLGVHLGLSKADSVEVIGLIPL